MKFRFWKKEQQQQVIPSIPKKVPLNTLENIIVEKGMTDEESLDSDKNVVIEARYSVFEDGLFYFGARYTIYNIPLAVSKKLEPKHSLGCCGRKLVYEETGGNCTNPRSVRGYVAVPRDLVDALPLDTVKKIVSSKPKIVQKTAEQGHGYPQGAYLKLRVLEKQYGPRYSRLVRDDIDAIKAESGFTDRENLIPLYRELGKGAIVAVLEKSSVKPETALQKKRSYQRVKDSLRHDYYKKSMVEKFPKVNPEIRSIETRLTDLKKDYDVQVNTMRDDHSVDGNLVITEGLCASNVQALESKYNDKVVPLITRRNGLTQELQQSLDTSLSVVEKLEAGNDIRSLQRHEYAALQRQLRIVYR
jgi:hypothetical protein